MTNKEILDELHGMLERTDDEDTKEEIHRAIKQHENGTYEEDTING